jgi:hypothetical protein
MLEVNQGAIEVCVCGVRMCVCSCVRACVRVCVLACVRACVCVRGLAAAAVRIVSRGNADASTNPPRTQPPKPRTPPSPCASDLCSCSSLLPAYLPAYLPGFRQRGRGSYPTRKMTHMPLLQRLSVLQLLSLLHVQKAFNTGGIQARRPFFTVWV